MNATLVKLFSDLDARPTVAAYAAAARVVSEQATAFKPLRVAQLATYTLDLLTPYLQVEAARRGFSTDVVHAPFNSIRQELLDPNSGTARQQPDVVFISQLLDDVCPPLAHDYLTLSAGDVEQLIAQTVDGLLSAIRTFRERSAAAVVVANFPLPTATLLGIYEAQEAHSQTWAIHQLNARLAAGCKSITSVHVLDFERLAARLGHRQWFHDELWFTGHAPLTPAALIALAQTQATFLQAICGVPRKCLVVDLDNTLWGGVLGEEGVAGVQLGAAYPGNLWLAVQRELLQLNRRGVLLAINSKNNLADVEEMFQTHPDMLLKREHFAALRANWQPKPENMRSLAQELNIGLDSLVFLDDSPTECELMRATLPEVLTWGAYDADHRPSPLTALERLRSSGAFDKLSLTDDDRRRAAMYQEQSARREFETAATSLDDFLAGLQMTAELTPVDEFTLPRVADLLQKTNQFNLTTRRHTTAQLATWMSDPAWGLFALRVTDRFGDNGIVGVVLARQEQDTVELDSFLLSCRVIGRQVETAMLRHVIDWATERKAEYLIGSFMPTAKNAPCASFFADQGFIQLDSLGTTQRWLLPLEGHSIVWPAFIARGAAAIESGEETTDRILPLVATVLNVPLAELQEDSSPSTIPSWDSLNHLNLVLAIESEFGISLSPQQALAMQSVAQIRQVLDQPSSFETGGNQISFADLQQSQVAEFKDFIARSYGPNYVLGVNEAYFQWQYGQWQPREDQYRLRLALVNGAIAGCLGYIPVEVDVAGQRRAGAWLANWMVDPEHRQLGLGPLLAREIARDFEITLAQGANEDARTILARMGWRDFGNLHRYVSVIDPRGATVLTETGTLDWPTRSTNSLSATYDVQRETGLEAEAEALWDELRGADGQWAGTRRSVAYLTWRYREHPQFSYRYLAARRAGKLVGFAVYRVEEARNLPVRVGRIVELVAPPEVVGSLLAGIERDALAAEAVALDFFCASEYFAPTLQAHGFLPGDDPRSQQIPLLYQPIDRRRAGIRLLADLSKVPEAVGVTQWYITKSDGDQDRPN